MEVPVALLPIFLIAAPVVFVLPVVGVRQLFFFDLGSMVIAGNNELNGVIAADDVSVHLITKPYQKQQNEGEHSGIDAPFDVLLPSVAPPTVKFG